ncbi:hypothetical protein GFS60_07948 (plasmid) [Rhodococcus sp. WAY2]|nr:hypothetical protein GFS60_07948 [Rhodococcus sp. WAY2]
MLSKMAYSGKPASCAQDYGSSPVCVIPHPLPNPGAADAHDAAA